MLNNSDDGAHSYLAPDLHGNTSDFFPLYMMLAFVFNPCLPVMALDLENLGSDIFFSTTNKETLDKSANVSDLFPYL